MEWIKVNEEGEIEIVAQEVKLVPEFAELMSLAYNKGPKDADGRKKFRLKNELKYMYLVYSSKSPYRDYSEKERLNEAKLDCNLSEEWTESPELRKLIPKYIRGTKSKLERLLNTTEGFLDKLDTHLSTLQLNERKENGEYAHKPKEIIDTLKQLPALAQTLQDLELQVKLGNVGTPKSKGDHELGWMAMTNTTNKVKREEEDED